MTLIGKCLLFGSLLCAFLGTPAWGQTIDAASCSETDVTVALTAALTGSSPTVVIPAGTCTWTTPLYYTAPANLTIQGQTVCTGSGAPGQSGVSCSDNTVIVDGMSRCGSDPGMLNPKTNATGTFRITGLTIAWGGAGCVTANGSLQFSGSSQQFRMDHMHFRGIQNLAFEHSGNLAGVIDHILIDGTNGSGWRTDGDASTSGNSNWAAPTNLGGSNFMFFENNTLNTASNDCQHGGRWVIRYNTFNNNGVQTHPTGGSEGARGCRAWELYGNAFLNPTTNNFNVFFLSSGTGVIWGNSAPSGISNFVTLHSMRRDNSSYTQTAVPNGWGYCGTSFKGTGSNWDQNTNATTGYHCIDQPGLGKGDLLSGAFPNLVNTATGCNASSACAWPREASEPVYEWMDTWSGSGAFWKVYEQDAFFNNSDYYLWCNPSSPSGCTSFSGASGVGSGVLSARPSSCTAGVAYWATDTQTLYKCTSGNNWSTFYQPFTYPHPLDGGAVGQPAPPTNLQATVN